MESLLDGDADALDDGARLVAQLDQAGQRLAVGEEVIDEQHMVALVEIPLGDDDGEFLLLGERVHGRGVLVAIKVDGLRLLREHHGDIAEMTCRHAGDADAGSLDGQDLVDGLSVEMLGPGGAHMVEQFDIALMVEESIHFQHVAWFDGTLPRDALFELLHESP